MTFRHLLLICALLSLCAATQRPKGVHFDIEPYSLPLWETDQNLVCNQLLDLFQIMKETLNETGILLTADVPFWYDTVIVTRDGVTKPMHEWVLDVVDRIAIMDYRDWASGTRNLPSNPSFNGRTDNQIELAKEEISYADSIGKKVLIIFETMCYLDPPLISYCEDGTIWLESQMDTVREAFSASSSYDSNVIHYTEPYKTMQPNYTLVHNCSNTRDMFAWNAVVVTNPVARTAFFEFITTHAIRTVYVEVSSLIKTNKAPVKEFFDVAETYGISLELLYGDPLWALEAYHSHALSFLDASLDFANDFTDGLPVAGLNCTRYQSTTTGTTGSSSTTSDQVSGSSSTTAAGLSSAWKHIIPVFMMIFCSAIATFIYL